ncbi:hypothetical protein [Aquimarina sp. AU474]|uniref:hypothetical protein n=1 Tax=Aquimarina sp. AU474 TaxID=2108529 RepID=UPI000D69BCF7|nr:hypothetical protein [Aquimarina sp. AU474]
MKIWNVTGINKAILFLAFIGCFLSCEDKGVQKLEYYYNIYDSADNVKGYFKRVILIDQSDRTDTIYRYNKQKILSNQRVEKYFFNKGALKNRMGTILFSIKTKDSCVNYIDVSNNKFESCYLGVYQIDTPNKKAINSYKFEQKELIIDGIIKTQFLDDNFILVKEEFKEGTIDYYRIELTNEIKNLSN